MNLAEQLRYSANNRYLIGKTLSQCVSLAQAIGQAAEAGKQFTVKQPARSKFIGSIQVGEYILTGSIPDKDLCESVVLTGEESETTND